MTHTVLTQDEQNNPFMNKPELFDIVEIRGERHIVSMYRADEIHINGWVMMRVTSMESGNEWVAYDKEMIVVEKEAGNYNRALIKMINAANKAQEVIRQFEMTFA